MEDMSFHQGKEGNKATDRRRWESLRGILHHTGADGNRGLRYGEPKAVSQALVSKD